MTVEVTMIFPLGLSVCILTAFFGVYVYNRCVIEQDAYRAAGTAVGMCGADSKTRYNAVWDRFLYLSEGKYILADFEYEVTVGKEVDVEVYARMRGPKIYGDLKKREWYCIQKEITMKIHNPVFFIRTCRALGISEDK